MESMSDKELTVLLLGKGGVGKSSLCNLLSNSKSFFISDLACSGTKDIIFTTTIQNYPVVRKMNIIDTVGFGSVDQNDEDTKILLMENLEKNFLGIDVILFLITKGRVTEQDYKLFMWLKNEVLGKEVVFRNMVLVITRCGSDCLFNSEKQSEWIVSCRNNPNFHSMLLSCSGRCCFIDNPSVGNPELEPHYQKFRTNSKNLILSIINEVDAPFIEISSFIKYQKQRHDQLVKTQMLQEQEKRDRIRAEAMKRFASTHFENMTIYQDILHPAGADFTFVNCKIKSNVTINGNVIAKGNCEFGNVNIKGNLTVEGGTLKLGGN